ncbi:MAG: hypothetical protein RIB43_13850 [Rhodospirillaceae bacterium]
MLHTRHVIACVLAFCLTLLIHTNFVMAQSEAEKPVQTLTELNTQVLLSLQEQFRLYEMTRFLRNGTLKDFVNAAENGDSTAQTNLAMLYFMGWDKYDHESQNEDVIPEKRDVCLTRYWLTVASKQGDLSAITEHAYFYALGSYNRTMEHGQDNMRMAYLLSLEWGSRRGFSVDESRRYVVDFDEKADSKWLEEYKSWSLEKMPLPPKVSCQGCPPGQIDKCLAEQSSN